MGHFSVSVWRSFWTAARINAQHTTDHAGVRLTTFLPDVSENS
jgi:hypothetical protein